KARSALGSHTHVRQDDGNLWKKGGSARSLPGHSRREGTTHPRSEIRERKEHRMNTSGCPMGSSPRRERVAACVLAMVLVAAAPVAGAADEAASLAENDAAMKTMMDGMEIQPSGDVARDFVAMMLPHHEGAIAMARAELRHGRNEPLRRLTQEIIVTQS